MTLRQRNVVLKEIPEPMNELQMRSFMRECQGAIDVDRPCLVLDCSKLTEVETPIVNLLLVCLKKPSSVMATSG